MPVRFYPTKPIDLLEKYIIKDDESPLYGEIDVYRKLHAELILSDEDWHIWHDLKIPKHSDLFNTYNKTSAQIDFLILCKYGVLILEVKGGYVSLKENSFYYGKHFEKKMSQDPFRQAEGYKHTLKDKILNNIGNCFFCHSVSLPHVDYSIESKIFDKNLLWSKFRAPEYNDSIESFIKAVFEYTKNQHKKFNRFYPELSNKEIESVKKILSPIVEDSSKYDSINTLEWLQVNNLEIIEGLYKNKRIMIEGPPGSGKTTIAKAYIDQQIGKKGLYLCWNNLLMHYTKQLLSERNIIDEIEVSTLTRFLKKLDSKIDMESLFELNENQFYDLIKEILKKLEQNDALPIYDYIVVDEGQDVFDKGLDLIINKMCGYNRSGLINGTSLILYDIDQSYTANGRSVLEISDLLSEYFSHFKLNEVKRSAQNPDIRQLAIQIYENPEMILDAKFKNKFPQITIAKYLNLESIKKYLVSEILSQIRSDKSSLRGGDCIILIESTLLRGSFKNEPDMHYWLTIKDVEELNETNVSDKGNKLRYSSILKFKGLEKKNVFLLITEPSEKNKYELYVGITRAIHNLEVLIVEQ